MEKQKCTEQLQHNRCPTCVGPEFAQDPSSSALEKAQASAWEVRSREVEQHDQGQAADYSSIQGKKNATEGAEAAARAEGG